MATKETPTTPRKRIDWTPKENRDLARAALTRFGLGEWPMSAQFICNLVQGDVLPEDRRRKFLKTADSVTTWVRYLKEEREAMLREQQKAAALDVTGGEGAAPEAADPYVTPPYVSPPPPPPAAEGGGGTPEEVLVAALTNIRSAVSSLLAEVFVDAIKKVLTHHDVARMLHRASLMMVPESVVVERPPRHRDDGSPQQSQPYVPVYLVCGFKAHQQHFLQNQMPGIRLRFWYADNPASNIAPLRDKAKTADAVFFTMEASSHTAVDVVKQLGKRLYRVTGGATAMVAALRAAHKEFQDANQEGVPT